jgi:hypothetical protein
MRSVGLAGAAQSTCPGSGLGWGCPGPCRWPGRSRKFASPSVFRPSPGRCLSLCLEWIVCVSGKGTQVTAQDTQCLKSSGSEARTLDTLQFWVSLGWHLLLSEPFCFSAFCWKGKELSSPLGHCMNQTSPALPREHRMPWSLAGEVPCLRFLIKSSDQLGGGVLNPSRREPSAQRGRVPGGAQPGTKSHLLSPDPIDLTGNSVSSALGPCLLGYLVLPVFAIY